MKKRIILYSILTLNAVILFWACLTPLGQSYYFSINVGIIEWKGFFAKPNWYLSIFFWIPVLLLAKLQTVGFKQQWCSLQKCGILAPSEGALPEDFHRSSFRWIILGGILFAILSVIDSFDTFIYYFNSYNAPVREHDFCFFFIKDVVPKYNNLAFCILIYAQQTALAGVAGASYAGFLYHTVYFWYLGRRDSTITPRVSLKLNARDGEFGLHSWNNHLNNIYWCYALVLLIPIISLQSQEGGKIDFGQKLLQLAVITFVASPMAMTILARSNILQRQLDDLEKSGPDETSEIYRKQLLWPLDKNWASKLGIVLVTFELGFLFSQLPKIFG